MEFSIRAAVRGDAQAVEELMSEAASHFRSLGVPDEAAFDAESFLRDGFGPSPAFSVLVADTGAEILGHLLYHMGYDVNDAARVLHVIDLYVRSDSRRLGVGRCLMEEAASVCRDVGGSRVLWSVYKINEPAFSFYEDLGASYCDDETFMKLDV